jgi:hypothetical protein
MVKERSCRVTGAGGHDMLPEGIWVIVNVQSHNNKKN